MVDATAPDSAHAGNGARWAARFLVTPRLPRRLATDVVSPSVGSDSEACLRTEARRRLLLHNEIETSTHERRLEKLLPERAYVCPGQMHYLERKLLMRDSTGPLQPAVGTPSRDRHRRPNAIHHQHRATIRRGRCTSCVPRRRYHPAYAICCADGMQSAASRETPRGYP